MSVKALEAPLAKQSPQPLAFKLPVRTPPPVVPRRSAADGRRKSTPRTPPFPLWIPHPPRADYLTNVEVTSPVCYNMSLSGPRGDMLPLLNRIVCLVCFHDGLRGFIFHYDNGETTTFVPRVARDFTPRKPYMEQSFMIDGKGGERVVDLISLEEHHRVSCLGVSTSQTPFTMAISRQPVRTLAYRLGGHKHGPQLRLWHLLYGRSSAGPFHLVCAGRGRGCVSFLAADDGSQF